MRKLIVPQEAVERHEKTLGKALLGYLEYLSQGRILTFEKGGNYQATKSCCIDYWKWVYEQFRDEKILTASPMELFRFAKENRQKIRQVGYYCGNATDLSNGIVNVTRGLFAYEKLRSGHVLVEIGDGGKVQWSKDKGNKKNWKGWSLAEYFRLLDIRYCPYCNAETVGLVKREDQNADKIDSENKESYSAIDHVLQKNEYPLLALSLCNLVPVCYRCNSQFKKDKDLFRIEDWSLDSPLLALHPYVHSFHKWFRFDYAPTNVEVMFVREGDNSSPLSVEKLNPLPEEKVKSLSKEQRCFYLNRVNEYLETFVLRNCYRDLYATEINELLMMLMICTPEFVSEMKRLYKLSESDFDLIFRRTSLDPGEINHHRFAKLTIDFVEQIRSDASKAKTISEWKKWFRRMKGTVT